MGSMVEENGGQRKVRVENGNGEGNLRQKMVEEDNGLWTVECLRGRLLAERLASKAAKQEEELMGRKLMELEEKLRLEIQFKNKAEKTLKILLEKLESLKLSPRGYGSSSTASSCITTLGEQTTKMEKCNDEAEMSGSSSSLTSEDLRKINLENADVISPGSRAPSVSSSTGDEDADSKPSERIEDCRIEESVKAHLSRKSKNYVDNKVASVPTVASRNSRTYIDNKGASVPTGVRFTLQSRKPSNPEADSSCNNTLGDNNQLGNSVVKSNAINSRTMPFRATV